MEDDNINQNGEIAETPDASPAETITPGDDGQSVNLDGAGYDPSPEEVNWNTLKGNTQDRIRQLVREKRDAEARASRYESLLLSQQNGGGGQATMTDPNNNPNSGVQEAVRKLDEIGVATKDHVDSIVNQRVGGLVYQMEMDKLESRYDGSNGLPKFDKMEYEDYIQSHPQYRNYSPEDVYEKMYADEIFDWKLQHQGRSTQVPAVRQTTSLRPNRTQVREEPLTPESIERRLQQPDGPAWYDKNKEKINAVLSAMAPED